MNKDVLGTGWRVSHLSGGRVLITSDEADEEYVMTEREWAVAQAGRGPGRRIRQALLARGILGRTSGAPPDTPRLRARVNSSDPVFRGALERRLDEAGMARGRTGVPVEIVNDYLDPLLDAANHRYRKAGMRWAPVKFAGETVWAGPLFEPTEGPCWECLAIRLREKRAARHPPNYTLPAIGKPTSLPGQWEDGAAALAAGALRQLLANRIPAGRLWRFEWRGMTASQHVVTRLPYCPVCGAKTARGAMVRSSLPLSETAPTDLSWRMEAAADSVTGVLWKVERQTPQFAAVVPCFRAQIAHPLVHHGDAPGTGGRSAVAGKAWTEADARAGCIAEAVERYSLFRRGCDVVRTARIGELGGDALHPRELLAFSDAQYAGRERWNRAGRFPLIPPRFDESVSIDWLAGTSLITGKRKWVPAGYCLAGQPQEGVPDFFQGAGNGCAAGTSAASAAAAALLELVERDAVAIWWYNRLRRPAIDLRSLGDPGLLTVEELLRARNRDLRLLDLTTDLAIPAFAAVSATGTGHEIVFGFGTELDVTAAARKAVAELVQLVDAPQLLHERTNEPDLGFRSWLLEHSLESAPYCRPSRTVRRLPASIESKTSSPGRRLGACVSAFTAAGLEPVVVDLTRAETGIPVILAACPGLRHWWHRLGSGRLYYVPVRMGWLRSMRSERAMNPIPFFL